MPISAERMKKEGVDADDIVRMYLDKKMTVKDIAERIGSTPQNVSNMLTRCGIVRRKKPDADVRRKKAQDEYNSRWLQMEKHDNY